MTDTVTVNPAQGYTLMVDLPPLEAVTLTAGCAMGLCEVIVQSTLPLTGPSVINGVRIDLAGTILVAGSLGIQGTVALTGGTIAGAGTMTVAAGAQLVIEPGPLQTMIACALTNDGSIRKWADSLRTDVTGVFTNRGLLVLEPSSGLFSINGGGSQSGAITVDAGAYLRIDGGTHTFEATSSINGPGRLEITSGVMNVAARPSDLMIGTLWMPATGTLTGAGNRTIGSFDVVGGTFSGTGVTTVTGGWSLTASGPPVVVTGGHRLVILGPMTYERPVEPLTISEDAVLEIANSLAITGPAPIRSGGGLPGRIFIRPTGNLTKSTATDTLVEATLENSGTVTVSAGILSLSGSSIHSEPGMLTVATGAMLRFSGGAHTFRTLTNLEGFGQVEVLAGATLNLEVPGAVTGFTRLRIAGGTVNSARNVNITEDFTFEGGTLTGAGTTTIFAIATRWFNTGPEHSRVAGGHTLIVNGNTVYTAVPPSGLLLESGGVLEIAALFDIAGDNHHISGTAGSPGSIVVRAGATLRKSSGAGLSQILPAVNNATGGTVEVLNGTLELLGGGTSQGDFNVVAPGTLQFTNAFGPHTLQAGSRVMGTGNVGFFGELHTVAGTYAITGSTLINGGGATFAADASTTNLNLHWTGTVNVAAGKALTVNGLFTFTGGRLTGPGSTVVTGTVTFVDNYACHVDGHTLVLRSNTSYGTYSLLYVDNGGVLRNEAIFEITGDGAIRSDRVGAPRVENVGTFRKVAGTSTSTIEPGMNNLATVSVSTGRLEFQGGGTSTGEFLVASPGQLLFFDVYGSTTLAPSSSVSGTGDVYLDAPNPGPIAVNGSYAVTGLTLIYQGNVGFASPLPGASTDRLVIYFPTVDVATALTASTAIEFNGGTLKGSGTTTLLAGGTVTFNSGSWVTLSGHTLDLGGNTAFGNATLLMNSGAVLKNAAMFDISGDGNIYGGISDTFTNLAGGTLRKSGGTGQTMVGAALNNSGAVTVTSGTLYLSGGGSSDGSFVASAPGRLNFASSHTLVGTSSLGGTGDVYFSQMGVTTVGGSYAPTGSTFVIEGATATFTGAASTSGLTIDYGGIMEVPVSFSVSGPLTLVEGTLRGSGTTTLLAGGSATFGGRSRSAYLDGQTLVLNGNSSLAHITLSLVNGATIRTTAAFSVADGVTIASNAGGPLRIENGGTLSKNGTWEETIVHAPIVNDGIVMVANGKLTFNGGGSGAGSFDTSVSGLLAFAGGSYTLTGAITSSGGITVTGAAVNVSGSFAITGAASIVAGSLSLAMPSASVKDLSLDGGTFTGQAAVAVGSNMNWNGGALGGTLIVETAPSAGLFVDGTATKSLAGATLRNGGLASWNGTGNIEGTGGVIENLSGATFTATGDASFRFVSGVVPRFENRLGATFVRGGIGTTTTTFVGTVFQNDGSVQVNKGTLSFTSASFIHTAGSFFIAPGAFVATNGILEFQGGSLSGGGTINGSVMNTGAVLRPGASPGILTISGDYMQGPSGSLDVELAGLTAGTQFDQINVTGNVSLGGTLNVVLVPPYIPVDGDSYRFLTFGTLAPPPYDAFATTNGLDLGMGDVLQLAPGATYIDILMNGNYAPVAVDDAVFVAEDTSASFAVLANDTDQDGDPLTIVSHTPATFGSLGCGATSCSYLPNSGYYGADSFTYTITDGVHSATATVLITVSPVNDLPVATGDAGTTAEDAPVAIDVLANDSDPDGDTLSIVVITPPAKGTVSCAAPSCTYSPAANFNGTDSFSYAANDGTSNSSPATVTITITPVNDAPTAVPDSGTTVADQPVVIGVLANDSDVDGDPVTVTAWTNGALGTVACTAAGSCTYTPKGMSGTDSFTYTIADGSGATAQAAVTIAVSPCENIAPGLVAPAAGAELTPSVTFEWTVAPEALRYHLILFSGGTGQQELALIPQPAEPLPSAITTTLTVPLGTFSWWVVADFPSGCPSLTSADRSLTVVRDCPIGTPEPLEPLEEYAIDRTPVIFRWSAVPGAVGYTLFVTINDTELLKAAAAPEPEKTPSAALDIPAGATVSWYVEATLPEGCGIARSRTVRVTASCFPPVLSLQGEVTTDKPYQVRATIVSVGLKYLFEESESESFATVLAQKEGETDPTGEFVFTTFEHANITEPKAFYYRVRLEQQGCAFSDVGRIVVIPLPPPTSTKTETVVQEGTKEEIRQDLFIPSPTPTLPTNYTYLSSTDREWMRVDPPAGVVGPAGVTVTIISDPTGLPVGTNTGTVTLAFIPLSGAGKTANDTASVTTTKPVSVTLVTPVTNRGKDAPLADSLIIPAVAHATGVNSEWQTDLRLLNMGSEKQKYALNLTISGEDGTQSGKSSEIELAAGQNSALNDVVKQWYGLGSLPGEGATGTLEIRPLDSSGGAGKGAHGVPVTRSLVSLASSRTYNRTPEGTLGEHIPAIPFASFVGGTTPPEGEKSVLSVQQLSQSSAYRSNLGVVEASGAPVDLEIRFFNDSGTRILTLPLSLKAGEHRQLNQVLAVNGLTNVPSARAEIEVLSGSGKIAAYASVVDNVTGDPLQVAAVDLATLGASKYVMPGIAHFNTGQARWRTDVQLFNAGLAGVSAQVDFFPVGASTPSKTATVNIGPGAMQTLVDIVPTLFGETNTGGAIQISTATNSELVVSGRTYDQRDEGSYGQFMAAVTEDDAIALGDRPMQVLQMEQSSNIRSNLGIVEVSGKEVRVELTAFPAESRVTPRAELTLKPNEFRQLNAVLKSLNAGTTYNARIALRVIGGDGKIVAYGSAVDNMTQDPTYIPGQ